MRTERAMRLPLLLFTAIIFFLTLLVVDGYALNLLGLRADPVWLLVLIVAQFLLLGRWLRAARLDVRGDPLELAGFLLVVVGVWLVYLYPSLPTLLPPTYSVDPANHIAYANAIYSSGQIISDYPGAPLLIAATLAHWIGWLPIRVYHPLGALWVALTGGALYLFACAMLPRRSAYKMIALVAPFALFVPWSYDDWILIHANYFFAQAAAQLFLVAFVLFLTEYLASPRALWLVAMGLSLIAISVSFQLWLAVPCGILGWTLLWRWRTQQADGVQTLKQGLVVAGMPAAFWIAIFFLGRRFIPDVGRFQAPGAIAFPPIDALGYAFFALAAVGLFLLPRVPYRVSTLVSLFVFTSLQALGFVIAHAANLLSDYWINKTYFLFVFPLAGSVVIPVARAYEFVQPRLTRFALPAWAALVATFLVLGGIVYLVDPPLSAPPLTEAEVETALWAKQHLDTTHVNFVGTKSLEGYWLYKIWGENLVDEFQQGRAALGPKTLEEWRADPAWGEYLYVSSRQHFAVDSGLSVIYQYGDSELLIKPSFPAPVPSTDATTRFGDVFALVDSIVPSLGASQVISFALQIVPLRVPSQTMVWRLQLRDAKRQVAAEFRRAPFDDKYPAQRWPDGVMLTQPFAVSLPPNTRQGLYDLRLGLVRATDGELLQVTYADGSQEDAFEVGKIKIAPPALTEADLASIARADVRFGDAIALLGYRVDSPLLLSTGSELKLILYWQSRALPQEDYTVFVHLLDSSGALRAQDDAAPVDGAYPTSAWDAGEIVVDSHTVTLPRDMPPGEYRIEVGMYSWPSLKRQSAADASGTPGDHYVLPIRVSVH